MSINQRPPHLLRWPVQHCPAKQQIIRQFGEDAEKILVGRGQQPDRAQFTSTTPVLGVKITRAVTSRSVSAGVVEIRKAFERVKEELETESNCNYGRECAGGSLEDYKQHHSLFSLQQPVSSSHYQHQHVRMSSLDSKTAACHLVTATVSWVSVTVVITAALRHWPRPLRSSLRRYFISF